MGWGGGGGGGGCCVVDVLIQYSTLLSAQLKDIELPWLIYTIKWGCHAKINPKLSAIITL